MLSVKLLQTWLIETEDKHEEEMMCLDQGGLPSRNAYSSLIHNYIFYFSRCVCALHAASLGTLFKNTSCSANCIDLHMSDIISCFSPENCFEKHLQGTAAVCLLLLRIRCSLGKNENNTVDSVQLSTECGFRIFVVQVSLRQY